MIPELAGKKIWIESEFESRVIQGLLFNAGYAWPSDFKKILEGVKFIRIGDTKTLSRTYKGKFDYTSFLEAPEKNIYLSTLKDLMPDIVKSYATEKPMKHPLASYVNEFHPLIGSFTDNRNIVHSKGTKVRINGLPHKSSGTANGLAVPIITSEGNIDVDISFLFTPDVIDAVKRHMNIVANANYGKEAIKSISSQPTESFVFFTTWYANDSIKGKTYRLIGKNTEIMCVGKSNLYPNGEGMIYQMRGDFYSFNAKELVNDVVNHKEFYDIFKHNATFAYRISTDINEFTRPISATRAAKISSETLTISDSSGSIAISIDDSKSDGTSIIMPNVTKVKANKEIKVDNNYPKIVVPTMPVKKKNAPRDIIARPNILFLPTGKESSKRIN